MNAVSVLKNYIKLSCVYVKFKRANQSCSPSKISQQSMLIGALVIEMVSNSLSESKKNFGQLVKQGKF